MRTLAILCCSLFLNGLINAQQLYVVTATDFAFSPDTLNLTIGDTVVINSVGYHSMTQVDSLDWENNVATSNGGFWVGFMSPTNTDTFVVNTLGTFYYNCNPHATMGMKGIINVSSLTGVQQLENTNSFAIVNKSNGVLALSYKAADEFALYDITGKLVYQTALSNTENTTSVVVNAPKGIYVGVFKSKTTTLFSQKIVIR